MAHEIVHAGHVLNLVSDFNDLRFLKSETLESLDDFQRNALTRNREIDEFSKLKEQ